MTKRAHIAEQLRRVALWLRFRGDDGFRTRAYDRAADSVEAEPDFDVLLAEQRLAEIPGVGEGISKAIYELAGTGRLRTLDELRGDLPDALADISIAAGLSPAKVMALYTELQVASFDELTAALTNGRVARVRGFGQKTVDRVLRKLARAADPEPGANGAMTMDEAHLLATQSLERLKQQPGVAAVAVAGELRRAVETCEQVTLVVAGGALDALVLPKRVEIVACGPADFGRACLRATGPAAHAAAIERLAGRGDDSSEAAIYARAGLAVIPPELRDRGDIVEAARAGERWDDLVREEDLRGAVHCHTTYSDGKSSIAEMAHAAEAMGLHYLTITDHSPSASYAGGVELDRMRRQWDEIAEVQTRVKVRLLRGTESDILRDGALDYPDVILEQLDVVIASIHVRHKLERAEMTARIVRAMKHPVFKIWGHALGRMLGQRPPIDVDLDAILDAIAESRAAIEVNGDPHRLDLPPAHIPAARARNIRFVVSSDAHSVRGLGAMRYGAAIARRGGLRKREVLNTLDADAFAAAVRPMG